MRPKPEELRRQALTMIAGGASVRVVARELGVGKSTVADWAKATMAEALGEATQEWASAAGAVDDEPDPSETFASDTLHAAGPPTPVVSPTTDKALPGSVSLDLEVGPSVGMSGGAMSLARIHGHETPPGARVIATRRDREVVQPHAEAMPTGGPAGARQVDVVADVVDVKSGSQSIEGLPDDPVNLHDATAPVGMSVTSASSRTRPDVTLISAAENDPPDDAPGQDGLAAAGIWVKARDTGRVLMLQRSFDNPNDPAAGTWEAPGGLLEGDDPWTGAQREWHEETGLKLPDGTLAGSWISPNGVYEGFVYVIASEDDLDLRARDFSADPDGDYYEALAFMNPATLPGLPDLRPECQTSDWQLILSAGKADMGEGPGHEFRGNQYVAGQGGDAKSGWTPESWAKAAERTLTVPAEANLPDHKSAYEPEKKDDDGCGCGCGKCSSTCNGKCCADCEMKQKHGEGPGHEFHGNQYVAGSGGARENFPFVPKGSLPAEPPPGYVRLYRGEGGGSGERDAGGKPGLWFTTDRESATYYSRDPNLIRAVDVPRKVAAAAANSPLAGSPFGDARLDQWMQTPMMEFRLPPAWAKKAVWADPPVKAAERYDLQKLPADHHHEDEAGSQPVICWDLHGTLTPSDGFPVAPPFPWVKPLLDELDAAGICNHITTAALDPSHPPEVLDARRNLTWGFVTEHALPIRFVTGKVGAHVYLDDRMVEARSHDGDDIRSQIYRILNKRAEQGPDGIWRLIEMGQVGEPIEEWPEVESHQDVWVDHPRGFSTPVLDVDVHRCLLEANSSKNDSGLKPGALTVTTTLFGPPYNYQIHYSCAGFDPSAKDRETSDQRLAGLRRSVGREGAPYDMMVTKNHATVFVDDKGMWFDDELGWLGLLPELLRRMGEPEEDDEITALAKFQPIRMAEKTDQVPSTQPKPKRNQTHEEEDKLRTATGSGHWEQEGPALQENDQSTPTDPDQLQTASRRMAQERGSTDEMSGTGLERGVTAAARPSNLGRLYADHPQRVAEGVSAGDLQYHDHPILNRLYMEAMHRYANLVNNGVARHHALAAVQKIDPDFYIEEAQHTWLLEQLAARAKAQKGRADDPRAGARDTSKRPGLPSLGDANPNISVYKMGDRVLVAPGGALEEGLALAITAFNLDGCRQPELLLMGWSPPQPVPPKHVLNAYAQYEWGGDDTTGLADYLGQLYRDQYLETLNDHLTQSGVPTVDDITDPDVLQQLNDRAAQVAQGVGDSYNRDLANQTYLTWIEQRSTLGRQSSEYTLAQAIDDWAAQRAQWKADQIAITESGAIASMAANDFIQQNPDAAMTGHVEPLDAVCEVCRSYVDQGTMDANELASLDLPAHPNCEHAAVYDIDPNWAADRSDVWAAQAADEQPPEDLALAMAEVNTAITPPADVLQADRSPLGDHLKNAHGVEVSTRKLPSLSTLHQRFHRFTHIFGTPNHSHAGPDCNDEFRGGEGPGHPFHGNQYVTGEAGSEGAEEDANLARADKLATDVSGELVRSQIEQANDRNWRAQNKRDFFNRQFRSIKEVRGHLEQAHGVDSADRMSDPQLIHARLHSPTLDVQPNHDHFTPWRHDPAGHDTSASVLAAGEASGHPFRGNQYQQGDQEGAFEGRSSDQKVQHLVDRHGFSPLQAAGLVAHPHSDRIHHYYHMAPADEEMDPHYHERDSNVGFPPPASNSRVVMVSGQTAIPSMVAAGEGPGHPFRGNQYTTGQGGGAGEESASRVARVNMAVGNALNSLPPELQAHVAGVADKLRAYEAANGDTKSQFYDPQTGRYSAEREAVHQQIINDMLARAADVPADHQAIVMGGLGGAGKSSLLRAGAEDTPYEDQRIVDQDGNHVTANDLFGVQASGEGATREEGARITNYLNLNSDDIKEQLMQRGLAPKIDGVSPMEMASLLHEESHDVAAQLADKAQEMGKNVIWDVTLGSKNSGAERIGELHDKGYKVNLAFVSVSVDHSMRSAMSRYARGVEDYQRGKGLGGRYVLPEYIASGIDGSEYRSRNEEAFFGLIKSTDSRTKPDSYIMIDNENYARQVTMRG